MSNKREWEGLILEWEQSGMKMAAWCRENSVKASGMRYWNKKLNETKPEDIKFTEIQTKPKVVAEPESKLIIKVGDIQIEITDTTNLELLSKVVQAITAC